MQRREGGQSNAVLLAAEVSLMADTNLTPNRCSEQRDRGFGVRFP